MSKPYPPVQYAEYLHLDKLLSAQIPLSKKYGTEAHDEFLFILVHQAYEIWFKQILHELNSVKTLLSKPSIDDQDIFLVHSRLNRVTKIQALFVPHLEILETMTPMDFLEFRDMLIPASGFQSFQFRQIENLMGLENRHEFNDTPYYDRLSGEEKKQILSNQKSPSLFSLVETWLERTPFLEDSKSGFHFWNEYKLAIEKMLEEDEKIISTNTTFSKEQKESQLKQLKTTRLNFEALLDEKKHLLLIDSKQRRLSFKATQAALLIFLYRDMPVFHTPFNILNSLIEIDENFTSWRARHVLMVKRMIGTKIGTGGSIGHEYLKQTAEKHQVYTDLMNLSTYLIPRNKLPAIPNHLLKLMHFGYSQLHDGK